MDEMTALDRQIAREVVREAGPSEPVDGAAMLTAITTSRSPVWRFQSMFSATKLVVAGAIVALFGGFLLAGVLTQPTEDRVPAAVTDSPEPTTELLPSVDFVTEQVEPGVERIVSDGIRDLSAVEPDAYRRLFAAPDGQIWLWTDPPTDRDGVAQGETTLVKLGDPGSYAEGLGGWLSEIRFAPDGTPLALVDLDSHRAIQRFGGSGWSTVREVEDIHLEMWGLSDSGLDGVAWDEDTNTLLRLDDSGWTEHPLDPDGLGLRPTLDAYSDAMWRLVDGEFPFMTNRDVRVDAQGTAWVVLATLTRQDSDHPMALVRFDGESWSLVDPLGVEIYYRVDLSDVGSDGTLWVSLVNWPCDGIARPSPIADAWPKVCHLWPNYRDGELQYLARLTDDEWTVYSPEDGVATLGNPHTRHGLLRVAPDGAVWIDSSDESPRIRTFDGETWRQYLEGHSVHDMDFAPDGKVWVLASTDGSWPQHVYRIDPEAAAGTGS